MAADVALDDFRASARGSVLFLVARCVTAGATAPAGATSLPAPTAGVNATVDGTRTSRAPAHFGAAQLALVINTADPLSVKIGAYYAKRRHIPQANILRVQLRLQSR